MGGLSGPAFRWVRVGTVPPAPAFAQVPAFRGLYGRTGVTIVPGPARVPAPSPAFRWLHGRVGAV